MPERTSSKVPFAGDDPLQDRLWAELESLPRGEPSAELRTAFYRGLEARLEEAQSGRLARLRDWLGMSGSRGWLTATACALLGIFVGLALDRPESADPTRLAALEQNVALLNRELILDRLQDAAAGKRLLGVLGAANVAQADAEIARALMVRATEDRVHSVRLAAIEALGPSMRSPAVATELMNLLANTESPLVQLALVDLVLRHGSDAQLRELEQLADGGRLRPELIRHVKNAMGSESV